MLGLVLLASAQVAVQPGAEAPAQGDIAIHATVDSRSAKIRSKGDARISATALPDAGSTATSSGTVRSGHFELRIDARIADPLAKILDETVASPQR